MTVWGVHEALGMTPAGGGSKKVRHSKSPSATGGCSELFRLYLTETKRDVDFCHCGLEVSALFSDIFWE